MNKRVLAICLMVSFIFGGCGNEIKPVEQPKTAQVQEIEEKEVVNGDDVFDYEYNINGWNYKGKEYNHEFGFFISVAHFNPTPVNPDVKGKDFSLVIEVKNLKGKDKTIHYDDFTLVDTDGHEYRPFAGTFSLQQIAVLEKTLKPEESATLCVSYDVPSYISSRDLILKFNMKRMIDKKQIIKVPAISQVQPQPQPFTCTLQDGTLLQGAQLDGIAVGQLKAEEISQFSGGMMTAQAKGKFVVLYVAVFNNRDKAVVLSPDNLTLIDSHGNEYSSDSNAEYVLAANLGDFVTGTTVNPTMAAILAVPFDVPHDASELSFKFSLNHFKGQVSEVPDYYIVLPVRF